MAKDNAQDKHSLMISAIVGMVAIVGLVIVLSGGPGGAQTVEVYNPQAAGGTQCGQIITPSGYCYANCGGYEMWCPTGAGFDMPSKLADQGRADELQGYFDSEEGVSAFEASSSGGTFGASREFIEGAINGINCWQEIGGWVCTGYQD